MITLNTATLQNTLAIVILLAIDLVTNSSSSLVIGSNASGRQKYDLARIETLTTERSSSWAEA